MIIDNYEELAELICNPGEPGDDIYDRLLIQYGIDMETFIAIVDALMRFTPVMQIATLDGREGYARGFVHDGAFIVKQVVGKS